MRYRSSRIGRNSTCPCGSGLKFKSCCHQGRSFQENSVNPQVNGQQQQPIGTVTINIFAGPSVVANYTGPINRVLLSGVMDQAKEIINEKLKEMEKQKVVAPPPGLLVPRG